MHIISWNAASWAKAAELIRRQHSSVAAWMAAHHVDILALQEVNGHFPRENNSWFWFRISRVEILERLFHFSHSVASSFPFFQKKKECYRDLANPNFVCHKKKDCKNGASAIFPPPKCRNCCLVSRDAMQLTRKFIKYASFPFSPFQKNPGQNYRNNALWLSRQCKCTRRRLRIILVSMSSAFEEPWFQWRRNFCEKRTCSSCW